VNGDKIPSPEVSDNEMDTTQVNTMLFHFRNKNVIFVFFLNSIEVLLLLINEKHIENYLNLLLKNKKQLIKRLKLCLNRLIKQLIRKSKRNLFINTKFDLEFIRSTFEFSDLQITDENVLKLTPDRLLSIDIHPRSDFLAIVGCDRKGTVGLVVKVNRISSLKNKQIH
jgi:hypothetical protein